VVEGKTPRDPTSIRLAYEGSVFMELKVIQGSESA